MDHSDGGRSTAARCPVIITTCAAWTTPWSSGRMKSTPRKTLLSAVSICSSVKRTSSVCTRHHCAFSCWTLARFTLFESAVINRNSSSRPAIYAMNRRDRRGPGALYLRSCETIVWPSFGIASMSSPSFEDETKYTPIPCELCVQRQRRHNASCQAAELSEPDPAKVAVLRAFTSHTSQGERPFAGLSKKRTQAAGQGAGAKAGWHKSADVGQCIFGSHIRW